MTDKLNASHWYDGLFYSLTIDRIAGQSFARPVSRYVSQNSTALDIGCGVGTLVAELAKKCAHVTGVDLSPKMTDFARKKLAAAGMTNTDIMNVSAGELSAHVGRRYDYAIMTQFLHEIPAGLREKVMDEAMKVANEFIIADFLAPYPDTFKGRMIRFVEMSAGKEHNANFKDWVAMGGIDAFLRRHGLKINEERIFSTGVGKIVKAGR
ncbi:MAG TPA: class I SAM-dependent methyltransferase [Spirochaetota bacterium]|nr:class I SAM-dependent methyltransferase [Spirochaetota bacterium]HOD15625.1 class I SAM-dependent methyltransferase [Spirochaetota bacterium]HPG49989.1 class I SAM-dependent methyltransferase [Spirochaetota bacterium]HQL82223.1 class I SAM-dependent methyltransferase [Spirochaetota bacterium]